MHVMSVRIDLGVRNHDQTEFSDPSRGAPEQSACRAAGPSFLSTPREESSRRSPLAAELGASAREDRWRAFIFSGAKILPQSRGTNRGLNPGAARSSTAPTSMPSPTGRR